MSNLAIPHFGKLAILLSSKAKQKYAGEISQKIWDNLLRKHDTIVTELRGQVPKGYVLVTDIHSSVHDSKPHWTIDVYGEPKIGDVNEPIGCIHMYEDSQVDVHDTPRAAVTRAYNNATGGST